MDYLKKMLGIVVEDEVVEKMEEKEVEEEKKLTPQQLRKKYFLKRMKREDKKAWINGNREMGISNVSRIFIINYIRFRY